MNLGTVVTEYLKGQTAKGIRRARWREGTWLKINDHGVRDDLVEVEEGESRSRGYTLNAADVAALDWELVK